MYCVYFEENMLTRWTSISRDLIWF